MKTVTMYTSFLLIVFSLANAQTNNTSSNSTQKTTLNSNATSIPTLPPSNCEYDKCPKVIKLMKYHYPPYTTSKDGGKDGIFEALFKKLLEGCCQRNNTSGGLCVEVVDGRTERNHEDLNDIVGRGLEEHESKYGAIYYPLYGTMRKIEYQDRDMFPVIESPGVVYIEKEGVSQNSATKVLLGLMSGWPVLVLTIIMAAVSGIVMWALDSYWNPDELPRTFFKGTWEGFWWSFISMTTVGYGDIAPRSFFARIFSFFWILIGLTIISIFTGAVTSALTELSLTKELKLYGKKLVAFNNTEEHRYGVKGNVKKLYKVDNIEDFVDAVKGESRKADLEGVQMDAGLIDNYVAHHYKDKLMFQLDVAKVFDYSYSYSFLTDGALQNQDITGCLRKVLSKLTEDDILGGVKRFETLTEKKQESFNIFDPKGDQFKATVYFCLGIIFILIVIAGIWEYFYWIPKLEEEKGPKKELIRPRTPYTTKEEMLDAQCAEMQSVMDEEIVTFYRTFHQKIEDIRKDRCFIADSASDDSDEEGTTKKT